MRFTKTLLLALIFVLIVVPEVMAYDSSEHSEKEEKSEAHKETPNLMLDESDYAALEGRYIQNITQLTFDGKNGEAYFSPDGERVIFQSIRGDYPFYQIYSMAADGSDLKLVSTGKGKTTCAFYNPKGKKIIYASTHLDKGLADKEAKERAGEGGKKYSWDFDEFMDIFEANPDGSELKRLTKAKGYDAEGSYSPDGKKICFTSNRSGDLEIYVMNADGKKTKRLTFDPGYDGGPFFSTDGKKIIYRHFPPESRAAQLRTVNADGSSEAPEPFSPDDTMHWAPFPHPDGERVVYTKTIGGFRNFEIFLTGLNGEGDTRLTYHEDFDGLPAFSPDGRKLMWTSIRGTERSQMFVADFRDPRMPEGPVRRPEILQKELARHLSLLASDALEGREVGSVGARVAAEYLASEFREAGLEASGLEKTFFQPFPFVKRLVAAEDNFLTIIDSQGERALVQFETFLPLALSAPQEAGGGLVFAGYGVVSEDPEYDSFKGLDAEGKIVMVFDKRPDYKEPHHPFDKYAAPRFKAIAARGKGAVGLIIVLGPETSEEDRLVPLKHDQSMKDSGIPAISISRTEAERLFKLAGRDLRKTQKILDDMDGKEAKQSFEFPGVEIKLKAHIEREPGECRNVLAWLPPTQDAFDGEYLIIGAHYDHLGRSGEGSLDPDSAKVHNGADDNASGTSGLIELAQALADEPVRKRGILFMAFSGEESGILGSEFWVKNPNRDFDKAITMFNMDMIGRLKKNKLVIQGTGTSEAWNLLFHGLEDKKGLELIYNEDGYGPSDSTSFYAKGIPVLFFFTGAHMDYHKPSDDYDKINTEGMTRILSLIEKLAIDVTNLDERPGYVKTQRKNKETTGEIRVSLGTIPDYGEEVEGVLLTGVREGSPAQKAGVEGGDIIIGLAGNPIKDIYDYTYAIQALRADKLVDITVNRNGEIVKLKIKPKLR